MDFLEDFVNIFVKNFVFAGLLAIMMAYINDKYTQSFNSINKVSDELYTIKKQVEGMKVCSSEPNAFF